MAATTTPILYSFRRCPYAMRARMALLVSGMICEIREVRLSAKPPELVAVSTKATVPVLVLPDGSAIDESLDIMRWALAHRDPGNWLAGDDRALIAANDGPFKYHLDRYKYPQRTGSDPHRHRTACMTFLIELEQRLATQPNLCGERRSLTDAAIMPFVRQFAETDRSWFEAQPLPGIQRWLAVHCGSPIFAAAMVRHAPWKAGDAPTAFPMQ